jgi:predicted ATP-dependent Lon-type protease
MNIIKGFFVLTLMTGIIMMVIYFIINREVAQSTENKVVYKYIPKTLKEDEESPVYVSEIFKSMFTQPSVWIDSINENETRRKEAINKYYISQM